MIRDEIRQRVFEYLGGIIRQQRGIAVAIGGMPDHVHLLVGWKTDVAISELMRELKASSSKWIHSEFPEMVTFAWQDGYSIFSVSKSVEDDVKAYIENQAEHHKQRDSKAELRKLLERHQVQFNEQYFE